MGNKASHPEASTHRATKSKNSELDVSWLEEKQMCTEWPFY